MRNILLLFARFGAHITFIGLELFCFYLIVNFNKTQKDIYLNSASLITGKLNEKIDNIRDYVYLGEVNDSLMRENAALLSRIINLQSSGSPSAVDLDSNILQYHIIPSTICNSTNNLRHNYLTLCKGEGAGIRPGMGVISEEGIVGIVRSTSTNYALVIPIINALSHTSAAIKGKNHYGTIYWQDDNPLRVTMEEVPKHANIVEGDTVITSGYSTVFPRGLMIGIINNFSVDRGSANYTIDVKLCNDITSLEYVYVIDNRLAEEQQTLENELLDE